MREIRLILGDQLNVNHSWFDTKDDNILYVMMEILPESEYVRHHIQKITAIFLAMREFSSDLSNKGHNIRYFKISDQDNAHSFKGNLETLIKEFQPDALSFLEPDEYRLDNLLEDVFGSFQVPYSKCSTEHFFTGRYDLKDIFKGRKQWVMEYFYRHMRKKHQIMVDDGEPWGGDWNYDTSNRKKLPKDHTPPEPLIIKTDIDDVVSEIHDAGISFIGNIKPENFHWPVTRAQSLQLLSYFRENLLQHFGDYQDSLSNDYWSLYHSRISFSLNVKLISPSEVIHSVIEYWQDNPDISINQVEGFVRQILGWREYMRGMYWCRMPEFGIENYLENKRKLPGWYWTGKTKMNCLSHAINQSLNYAYAHHIQRLMVTGNFALLTGIDPDFLDEWYLGIYADAFEWVEMPNTRGMSQFADGGKIATKPYVSSASYINKMGDHCKSCHYNHKLKIGEKACPFNSLYWNFLDEHRDKLSENPRMGMMYRLLEKMNDKEQILEKAAEHLDNLENL